MGSVAKATGAPTEFLLAGEKYQLYPLRFQDWGVLEQWVRFLIIDNAKQTIKGDTDLSNEQVNAIMVAAHREAAKVKITSCFRGIAVRLEGETDARFLERVNKQFLDHPESRPDAYLDTFEGMLRVVYLSLRQGQPQMTLDKTDELLTQKFIALIEMYTTVIRLSLPDETEEESAKKANETVRT